MFVCVLRSTLCFCLPATKANFLNVNTNYIIKLNIKEDLAISENPKEFLKFIINITGHDKS